MIRDLCLEGVKWDNRIRDVKPKKSSTYYTGEIETNRFPIGIQIN